MKTKTKIRLDNQIVGTIVRIVNLLVIPLGKILKIDHNLNRQFSTIAICKYKGMGSIIQSTPLIKTLKTNFPNAKIIFITSFENQQIINQIKDIDEVVFINDKSFSALLFSFFPFIKRLIQAKIEVFIDLEVYSNFSTLVSVMSLSKNRLGFYINSKHYRLGNYTHMMYYNTRSSIAETYLQFAGMLNCKSMTTDLYKFTNSITINEVNALSNLNTEEYIVINPNASDLRVERQWSKGNFIELIRQITLFQPSKQILLIGSKSESEYIDGIISELPKNENIVSVAGKTNIAELISIIKNAQILITNDTGPMHIAFAVETPTIALFGPCAPQQYGIGKNCIVVYQNLYCSPCVHEFVTPPCKGNNYCMKSIDVPSVFNLFVDFFEIKMNSNKGVRDKIMFQFNDFTIGTVNRK